MTVEGLYVVYFGDINGQKLPFGMENAGCIVLETGRVLGGDLQFYYIGDYELNGDQLRANICCVRHQGPGHTAWGTTEATFDVDFEGERIPNTQNILGKMQRGQDSLPVSLTWKSRLP